MCGFKWTDANARAGNNVLHETFGLTAEDARVDANVALSRAAENGHVEVLKWLHKTFGLTDDARANDNYALRWAAREGHVEVLKWLHTRFV